MLFLALLPPESESGEFEDLLVRYEKKIFNLIYRLVGDYDEAADLTQDTFVCAYKAMSSFRGDSDVYTWLYRIAVNNCKNRFKKQDRMREMEGDSVDDGIIDLVTQNRLQPVSDTPHTAVERKELRKMVEEAINRLPDDYRIVVVLRDLQGLSYNEISQTTGLGLDIVKTRLARGRGMLRQKLAPYLSG